MIHSVIERWGHEWIPASSQTFRVAFQNVNRISLSEGGEVLDQGLCYFSANQVGRLGLAETKLNTA